MNRGSVRSLLVLFCLLALPHTAPAPLVYRPGEGWTYEAVGSEGKWRRVRAKDQLEVAQAAFDKGDYGLAIKAANRVVTEWPLADYAPQAQYLLGRAYEAKKSDEKAFKSYQSMVERYPKSENYADVLKRQYEIACRFLGGQWWKLWGVIPYFPNMEKTADLFEKIIKNGPYGEYAPLSQLKIGEAWEKKKQYSQAVKAYEKAADRYHDQKQIASDALYKAGMAYFRQASTAEYDQNIAGLAIATLTDFMTLYPDDPRVEDSRKTIGALKAEQARGSYRIAQFYEKYRRWRAAVVYYNEVVIKDPESALAAESRQRIEELNRFMAEIISGTTTNTPPQK